MKLTNLSVVASERPAAAQIRLRVTAEGGDLGDDGVTAFTVVVTPAPRPERVHAFFSELFAALVIGEDDGFMAWVATGVAIMDGASTRRFLEALIESENLAHGFTSRVMRLQRLLKEVP